MSKRARAEAGSEGEASDSLRPSSLVNHYVFIFVRVTEDEAATIGNKGEKKLQFL